MLLEELLGEVLEVALGELLVGGDGDLGIIGTDDGDLVSETTSAALNLDAIVKELLLLRPTLLDRKMMLEGEYTVCIGKPKR